MSIHPKFLKNLPEELLDGGRAAQVGCPFLESVVESVGAGATFLRLLRPGKSHQGMCAWHCTALPSASLLNPHVGMGLLHLKGEAGKFSS